jgi:hypothetical protein
MTLQFRDPPAAVTDLVQSRLATLLDSGAAHRHGMIDATDDTVTLTAPHPVYVLDLPDIAAARDLSSARLTGWWYLVQQGDAVVCSAEAANGARGGEPRFGALSQGPRPTSASRVLESSDATTAEATQPRLLRVPAVQTEALWLHTDGADTLIPLAPAYAPLEAERLYPMVAFLDAIRPMAAVVSNAPPDTGG